MGVFIFLRGNMATATATATTAATGQQRPSFNTLTNKSTSPDRIASYQLYNADTAQTLEQLSLNNSKTHQRLRDCGHIDATVRCHNGHDVQVFRNQCREYRLCPMCASRRSKELFREIWPMIKHIEAKPVRGYKWRFITLTTRTCGNHKDAVALAIKAFTKLWRNMLKRPYVAAVRSLEFGPDTGNVHIHLLYYGPYVNQADLSDTWGNLTGAAVVDVRLAVEKHGSLKGAVREVIKYMTNYNKVEDKELLVRCWQAAKGRRLVQRYGLLFGRQSLERWLGVVLPKRPAERVPDATCCPICGSTELTTVISLRGPPLKLHGVQG